MKHNTSEQSYNLAVEQYAAAGVDVEKALDILSAVCISMHCWQGDDVVGFESDTFVADGGIMTTGDYPGRARNPEELRDDLTKALSLIPGKHKVNLHAIYAEHGKEIVGRDELGPDQFKTWADWAENAGIGLDFNPTFFSHPNVKDGFTIASADESIRKYWVNHGIASRKIGEYFGKRLGIPCITNFWAPDGYKDIPADRSAPRERMAQSLDEIFTEEISPNLNRDAVESKLFGIGSESYVVGCFEFYLGYALTRKKLICLDTGHFHPTEAVSDKISALLLYFDEILLHVSRGIRWDSDHIIVLNDDLKDTARETVRGGLSKIRIALDYFDASVNRVAAWVMGMRNMQKAVLYALLEPFDTIKELEQAGDLTARLAAFEDAKTMPFGAVWNRFCEKSSVPVDGKWLPEIKAYESSLNRG